MSSRLFSRFKIWSYVATRPWSSIPGTTVFVIFVNSYAFILFLEFLCEVIIEIFGDFFSFFEIINFHNLSKTEKTSSTFCFSDFRKNYFCVKKRSFFIKCFFFVKETNRSALAHRARSQQSMARRASAGRERSRTPPRLSA